MLRGLVWSSYAVVFALRCVSFKMGVWVCGSGGVRDVHVLICTRVVQIGVALGPGAYIYVPDDEFLVRGRIRHYPRVFVWGQQRVFG